MEDERRRYPRYSVAGLQGRLDGRASFEVVKISLGGMLVRGDEEAELGAIVPVSLDLGQERFLARARVVFVGPDTSRESGFRVGLAFEEPSPAEQLRLERFLRRELE